MDILEKLEGMLDRDTIDKIDEAKAIITDVSWNAKGGHIKLYVSPDTRDKKTIDDMVKRLAKQYKADIL